MKKALKVFLIFVISLSILAGAVAFIAPSVLTSLLKKALTDEFGDQTGHTYSLDFSTFEIGIFSRSITMDSIVVQPDSSSPFIRHISVSNLSIEGISWMSLWNRSFPEFSSITISEPDIQVYERDYSRISFSSDSAGNRFSNQQLEFDLTLKNGSGRIIDQDREEVFEIEGIFLQATNVNINQLLDGSELIFMDDLLLQGNNLKWRLEEELYEVTISNFSFNNKVRNLSVSDLAFTPFVPKYQFSNHHNYQLNRFDLNIPRVDFFGVNLDSLSSRHLEIDTLQLYSPKIEIFRNKQILRPPGINPKPLLNEIAHAIDFSLSLNTTIISKADIIYEEHKPPSDSPGSISFNELDASITNFRSALHPKFNSDSLRLHVETLFMNAAPLTVDVSYAVFDEKDNHTVKTTLKSLDPKEAQGMFTNVGFVRVEDGFVEHMEAKYSLNDDSSSGEVLVLYRDLKVSFLDKENPNDQKFKQKLTDFFANTFAIKSNNNGADPRIGTIKFEREIERSIFAYWWKSLLSGLKDSIK